MANQANNRPQLVPRHWVLEVVLGSVALGVSYLATLSALNTGSMIQYFIGLILLVLGVRHFVLAVRAWQRQNRN